ncbi:MAG: tetratricopeptide repeat protein [Actinomycetota bacterium]
MPAVHLRAPVPRIRGDDSPNNRETGQILGNSGDELGALFAWSGQFDEARSRAMEAVRATQKTDLVNDQADALFSLAMVSLAAGQVDEARDAASRSLEIYLRKGNQASARQAEEFLALL